MIEAHVQLTVDCVVERAPNAGSKTLKAFMGFVAVTVTIFWLILPTSALTAHRCEAMISSRIVSSTARNFPIRKWFLELPKIRDITNVVALRAFVHVVPIELPSGHLLDPLDRLQHGNACCAAAAQVVHLTGPRN